MHVLKLSLSIIRTEFINYKCFDLTPSITFFMGPILGAAASCVPLGLRFSKGFVKPYTINRKPSTLHLQPSTLNPKFRTLNPTP